jgi:hypothetical protein
MLIAFKLFSWENFAAFFTQKLNLTAIIFQMNSNMILTLERNFTKMTDIIEITFFLKMLFEFKNIQAFFTLALSTWMLLCELHNEWVLFLDIWVCNFFENTLLLASFAVFRISLARIANCFWTWEIWALQKIHITILALGALQPVVSWMEIIFFNIFRLKSELSF